MSGVFYNQVDLKPHRIEYWLNAPDRNTEEFRAQVATVCELYQQAPALQAQGVHLVSTDEKTGIQALERAAPTKPMHPGGASQAGKTERQEYEYVRHGTQCLIANFEIAAVVGQTVTFENTSTFAGLIDQEVWSFGDGAGATSSTPTNTFVGPGPFEICLTLVSSDPYCSATLCQWLYLGPGNVECAQLIDQGYWLLQADNLVGVLDTSRTSGMYSTIDWDFGDGAHATGNVAVHAYPVQGEFQLCGTLRAWGPLLGDTCISTVCHSVWPQLVGLEETPSIPPWSVSPNPCTDAITLWGDDAFVTQVVVLDALGRTVLTPPKSAGVGSARLDLSSLEVGPYLLHLSTPERSSAIRIIKR